MSSRTIEEFVVTLPTVDQLKLLEEQGGMLVEYQRISSLVLYMNITRFYVWVPPGQSRFATGLKPSIFSAILGWWSIPGLLYTPGVIICNLLGGVDATRALTTPGEELDAKGMAEFNRQKNTQTLVFVLWLAAVAIGLVVFTVLASLPYLPKHR